MTYTATYSPEDNKLRLYASSRLDAETYQRVKAAGFKWAPRQELFVAPMWTPEREDLCLELAGELDDEDTSLVERAEERADRFEGYAEHRDADADAAHSVADRLGDAMNGQPILVGHHSEKRHRRDYERMWGKMREGCKMWRTARYWEQRAAGAIRAAKYKERPDVRARRIKTLEAELRKVERNKDRTEKTLTLWGKLHELRRKADGSLLTPKEAAHYIANLDGCMQTYLDLDAERITPEEAQERRQGQCRAYLITAERWLGHYRNRIAYERAMLGEAGGTVADRNAPEVGGGVRCWATRRRGPQAYSWVVKVNKVSVTVYDNWGNGGANFTRTIPFDRLAAIISRADVAAARERGCFAEFEDKTGFEVTERSLAEAQP